MPTNLVPGDTQPLTVTDVFVHYVSSGIIQRVSVTPTGAHANGASAGPGSSLRGGLDFGPSISGDGSTVAFFTLASNLAPGDTNTCSINDQVSFTDHPGQCPDIYVHSG